jgi:hypothetical protein
MEYEYEHLALIQKFTCSLDLPIQSSSLSLRGVPPNPHGHVRAFDRVQDECES